MQKADDIALALLNHTALLAVGDPALPIAMPDVPPPWAPGEAPDRYLSVTLFDNVPRWQGVNGGKIGQGILQVEIMWARGEGSILSRRAAQAVIDHFPAGQRLLYDTAAIKIDGEPWHGSAFPAADHTSIPVSIPWVASAARPGSSGAGLNPDSGPQGGFYAHPQTTPSILWVVNHNLGYRPSATILSPGGVEVFAMVEHQSDNQLTVSFSVPQTGSVHCV